MVVKIIGDRHHDARSMSNVTFVEKVDILKRNVGVIRSVLKRLLKQQPLKDALLAHSAMVKSCVMKQQSFQKEISSLMLG